MVKRYCTMRIYNTTKEQIMKRVNQVNDDLKIMGVKRKIPAIRFIDEVAKRTIYIPDRELIQIARRRKRLC